MSQARGVRSARELHVNPWKTTIPVLFLGSKKYDEN